MTISKIYGLAIRYIIFYWKFLILKGKKERYEERFLMNLSFMYSLKSCTLVRRISCFFETPSRKLKKYQGSINEDGLKHKWGK